ncbi:MAG: hypothetical protein ABI862_00485 [Ilumatobacteraceae bacterium]
MSDNPRTLDLPVAYKVVQLDTEGVLNRFLDGTFTVDETLGPSNWRSDKSEFLAVRWRFEGKHVRPIDGFGHTQIPPTQNSVSVSGLTLVENMAPDQPVDDDLDKLLHSGTIVFHRFIDWLAVFAQIGVLHLGRPMSITEINFGPPDRGTFRQPGYNDQRPDDQHRHDHQHRD